MRGLDPRIHRKKNRSSFDQMDCGVKPGTDGAETVAISGTARAACFPLSRAGEGGERM
jgi:hypothetical protein